MASYIPSGASRALERSSENILRTIIEMSRMEQQAEQFERSFGLQERQFTEQQKGAAVDRVRLFAPFLLGQRVADVPWLHEDLRTVYPEFDPADETSLGAMSFGEKTFNQLLDERLSATIDEIPSSLMERALSTKLTGQPNTLEELSLRDDLLEVQRNHFDAIMQDPNQVRRLGNELLGLPQQITVSFPDGRGGTQQVTWSDEATARLSVSIWGMLQQQRISEGELTSSLLGDMAKNLQEIAEEQGYAVPTHMARRIVQTVHSGDPADTEALRQSFVEGKSEAGIAALEMYMTGADLADGTAESFLREFPALALYIDVASQIEDAVGKEQAAEIMPNIARQMRKAGLEISFDPRIPFKGFQVGPRQVRNAATDSAAAAGPDVDAMEADARADVEAYANGEITFLDLTNKWGRDLALLIAQESRQLQEGGGQ